MAENFKPDFAKADLGCGKWRKSDHLGWDNLEAADFQGMTEADKEWIVNWDLNKGIPVPDNCMTDIYISHFLEHVTDPLFLLSEVLRVCKNGARVEIYVPLFEMLSVGHITEFYEDWFEEKIPFIKGEVMPFNIIFKEINRDKPAELRLQDGTKAERKFDELHIILEVVK